MIRLDKFNTVEVCTYTRDQANQCAQIVQFIGLWADFQSLWQQLVYPNVPHS